MLDHKKIIDELDLRNGNIVKIAIIVRGKAALLVLDEYENRDEDARMVRRRALLDLHDVHKMTTFYPNGFMPNFSRPGTFQTLREVGFIFASVDRSLAHTRRSVMPGGHAGYNPTLIALLTFTHAFAEMIKIQPWTGSSKPIRAMFRPNWLLLYQDIFRVATEDSKFFIEKMFEPNTVELFKKMGLVTHKGFPSIEMQNAMFNQMGVEFVNHNRHTHVHLKEANKTAQETATHEFIDTLIVHRPLEFWKECRDELMDLPEYTHGGQGQRISELSEELSTSYFEFSYLGLFLVKDGEYIYRSAMLTTILNVLESPNEQSMIYQTWK